MKCQESICGHICQRMKFFGITNFFGSAMHTLGSVSATGLYVQTKSRMCKLNIENLQKIYTTKQETALLKN